MTQRRLLFIAKLLVSTLLLAWLYRRVDVSALTAQVTTVRPFWLALFILLLFANTLLSAVKWRILLAADNIRQPLGTLFASYLIASFFNVFLPSTIGGDVYRVADIGRRSARTVHAAASILADRLSGFLALAIYGLLFALLARSFVQDGRLLLLPAVALAGLLAVALAIREQRLLRWLAKRLGARRRGKVEGILDTLLASLHTYGRQPRVVAAILACSFLFQFLAILAIYALGRALSLNVPLLPYGFFVPFITLMEALPISIFGVGLRDTGYVWFMTAVGRTEADAAALSVLYVAATLAYVALGGVLFVFRRHRKEKVHAPGH